jgi:hypothetical protein
VADAAAGFRYYFAGESLASDLRLHSLSRLADITVRGFTASSALIDLPAELRPIHSWTLSGKADHVYLSLYKVGHNYTMDAPGFGRFMVCGSSLLVDFSCTTVASSTAEHFLLNQVLPMFLAQHGRLIVHAAGAMVEGACLLFAGESGAGKSTLSAAFGAAGAKVMTDDGVVIRTEKMPIEAAPTYRNLRLLPDSLTHFAGRATPARDRAVGLRKQAVTLPETGQKLDHFRPLTAIYFLECPSERDGDVHIDSLTPRETCMKLLGQSFQLDVTDTRTVHGIFVKAARVADAVPGFTLTYPRYFERLPHVTSAVLRHCAEWRKQTRPSLCPTR